jgi:hypothetical protein
MRSSAATTILQRVWIFTLLLLGGLLASQAADQPAFNLQQTISDGAQRTTLAFSGLAMMTGNLDAQSFFPPGKVADYTGFQYLRDNDPDNMGHNTSFLTRVAYNMIYTLNDSQLIQLKNLAVSQQDQINQYGYKRFALMQAFRRLLTNDLPTGATGLSLEAVKAASHELYLIDGQISFDRALLYAGIYKSMTTQQKAYMDAMKGKGWSSWPDITDEQVKSKLSALPQGTAVAVMTYAGDLFSWYAGSVEADVYFCPERQGTYYGGFYIKDAPAIGHEGYSIDEQLTATAGAALCDSSKGYVTADQATLMSSLVSLQKNNMYAGTPNIVGVRTQIATLLRGLLVSTANSDAVEQQVLDLSATYGDLDGENNYYYATIFAQVYQSLSAAQKAKLMTLRASIMSGTYADGTAFDFTTCTTPFLYSSVIKDESVLEPYIGDTDYLFNTGDDTTGTTCQPDLLIQPGEGADYVGDHLYNTLDAQTAVQATARNATATFNLLLRNNGSESDTMIVTAGKPETGWTVRYYDAWSSGTDITTAVIGKGWTSSTMTAFGNTHLRIEVTPDSTVTLGTSQAMTVTATSGTDTSKADAIQAVTSCGDQVLTQVRLAVSPASPVKVNHAVTLTATPVGGRLVQYCFFIYDGKGWRLIQPYSYTRTCTWVPTTAGTYALLVWAKEKTSANQWDVNATIWGFVVEPSVISATLKASPSYYSVAGSPVELTASPFGGSNLIYAFAIKNADGSQTTLRGYTASRTFLWIPTTAGRYNLVVQVKAADSLAAVEATGTLNGYTVTAP